MKRMSYENYKVVVKHLKHQVGETEHYFMTEREANSFARDETECGNMCWIYNLEAKIKE